MTQATVEALPEAGGDGTRRRGRADGLGVLAVACLAIATFVWQLGPQVDFDLWFDMRLGEHITRTHTIPHQVMFLSTGTEYSEPHAGDDEWGFAVLAFEVWRAAGDTGLALLKASLVLAIGAAIFAGCRAQGLAAVPAAMWAWLMLVMMRSRFMLRPQLLTDLLLAILVMLLIRRDRRLPWLVIPLFAVWSNVHPGVFGGLGVITLWTVVTLAARGDDRRRLLAACAAAWLSAWLLTPVDIFHSFHTVLMAQRKSIALIMEWAPLSWADVSWAHLAFAALYLFGFGTALAQRRLPLPAFVVITALGIMTVRHTRTVGELAAASALLAGPVLDGCRWLRPRGLPHALPAALALTVVVASGGFVASDLRRADRFDLSPPGDVYPLGGVDFLLRHPPQGALFDSYHFGGFLAWRGFAPFIHGMNSHYKETLFEQYLAILGDAAQRPALLDRFGITACLLAYPQGADTHRALIEWLARQPDWHLVHWDDVSLLFWKGPPPEAPYVAVDPALEPPLVSGDSGAVRRELERAAAASPKATRPQLLMADLRMRDKDPQGAIAICDPLIARDPHDFEPWMKRGVARFQAGDVGGAVDDLREAVRCNRRSAVARYDLGLACAARARDAQQRGDAKETQRALDEARDNLREALAIDPGLQSAARLLDAVGR